MAACPSLYASIDSLTCTDFRNYAQLRINTGAGFNLFTGPNGAGKTNIIEAVSLLAPGRGLRRAQLTDMAYDSGEGGFAVAASLGGTANGLHIGTGTQAANPGRRITRVNEANVATNDLSQWLAITWLTPAMDRIFVETAAVRRNFLDRMVSALEPGHARRCSRFENIRRERNRLLQNDEKPEPSWLDALDVQMAEQGYAIHIFRHQMVDKLNGFAAKTDDRLFAAAELQLSNIAPESEDSYLQRLRDNRRMDLAAGRTLYGPHRDDLLVRHIAKDQEAGKCSTGEQKALLFSILLAQSDLIEAERGQRPIMLLDEVAAHLDPDRRSALFAKLDKRGGQVWLTGTEPELFNNAPSYARHFSVEEGRVTLL